MRDLPTGTVTLLFSDIEGSTRLLDELGDRYAELLAQHHRRMREAFVPRGGIEVDTAGDAFFVAFAEARDAVDAAAAAQEALAEIGLHVRMGIHTGDVLLTETGYVGMDVHRAARIMSAGHGGQVLLSDETKALVGSPDGLMDLGLHRLKDLTEPQRLWQLGSGEFPPLKTLHQTNLPVQPTPLVGRQAELGQVLELLKNSRLVTLTGAGGSGKTRLALQAAAELVDEYKDGVWWVSLAALRDPELVEPAIAHAVGAKDGLAEHLRGKQALLLLDNLEQLLEAAPQLSALLAEAPELRLLATSRERLALAAEQEYAVPTMVPVEAVALFTARARQLRPDFEPNDAVDEICRRLDGLPLAVELAAARIKVLTPEQIVARLGESLELLTTGARDVPDRQRTLRATIEWSYDLLAEHEKEDFASMSVFAGSFDLEAAEAVCAVDLDALESLVDKSLVRHAQDGRFFMLETIREYASHRLETSSRTAEIAERHAEHFCDFAHARSQATREGDPAALSDLDAEQQNFRAALEWSLGPGSLASGVELLRSLWYFWLIRGYGREGHEWARRLVSATKDLDGDAELRSRPLHAAGEIARWVGDYEWAEALKLELLDRARAMGDDVARFFTLRDLSGLIVESGGDLDGARRLADEALALSQRIAEEPIRPSLGALTRAEPPPPEVLVAHGLGGVAAVHFAAGEFAAARRVYEQTLPIWRRFSNRVEVMGEHLMIGECRRREGDLDASARELRTALELAVEYDLTSALPELLQEIAALVQATGDSPRAARLYGASDRLYDEIAVAVWDEPDRNRMIAAARAAIGQREFEASRSGGLGMTRDEAIAYARASLAAVATSLTPAV